MTTNRNTYYEIWVKSGKCCSFKDIKNRRRKDYWKVGTFTDNIKAEKCWQTWEDAGYNLLKVTITDDRVGVEYV